MKTAGNDGLFFHAGAKNMNFLIVTYLILYAGIFI